MTATPEQRENVLEYQLLVNQIQQLQNHLSTLENHIHQLQSLHTSLNTLSTLTTPRDSFIPVGSGIFLKGHLDYTGEVLMNVGANTFVTKPVADALSTIEKQLDEVQTITHQFEEELEKNIARVEALQKDVQQ